MTRQRSVRQEIAVLEKRLAEAKATKPAHDTTGAYLAILVEIEDELDEKRQALAELGPRRESNQLPPNGARGKGG